MCTLLIKVKKYNEVNSVYLFGPQMMCSLPPLDLSYLPYCFYKSISSPEVPFSVHAVRELDVPGEIYERKTYPFEFSTVEMPYESYNGTNVRLR